MKQEVKNPPFSKDRPVVLLVVANAGLILATFFSVILRLRPNDFKIPIQFIVYDGTTIQTGNWFSLYSIVLFSIGGGIITLLLAKKLYGANRFFSLAVLAVYGVVALFTLFSVNALLTLVERV